MGLVPSRKIYSTQVYFSDSLRAHSVMQQVRSVCARREIALVLALCVAPFAISQSTNSKKAPAAKQAANEALKPTELTWPLPPDPPRIRWLAEYTDLAKVKKPAAKKSGWMEKVTGTKTLEEKLELRKPYGIAADRRGRIYTADTELKTVFVIDAAAKTIERRDGSSRAPLALPVGVALDVEDRLFVSDADLHSVICFSPSGQPLAHFGTADLGRPAGSRSIHKEIVFMSPMPKRAASRSSIRTLSS